MTDASTLTQRIRKQFGSIPFPLHCGLHAAMAKDDWICDEDELRRITQRSDYIGEWWDVPFDHLLRCQTALCYLDCAGMEFYLPAYMVAVLQQPPSCSSQIIFTFLPDADDPELHEYFLEQFSRIVDGKKRVCRDFLQHVAECGSYFPHVREPASEALANGYWAVDSKQIVAAEGRKTD